MGLSNSSESGVLNALLTGQTFGPFLRIWMSLHSASPADSGLNEIPAGYGYSRVEITGKFSPTAGDKITNNSAITFAAASTQYSITHWGIWGISSEGDGSLFYLSGTVGAEGGDVLIQAGKSPQIAIGAMTITAD